MAKTTFSGPVKSDNGFEGNVTGDVTGDVTGNVTGDVTGDVTASLVTSDSVVAGSVEAPNAFFLATDIRGGILNLNLINADPGQTVVYFTILGLPTTDPGSLGAVWNHNGTLKISSGP